MKSLAMWAAILLFTWLSIATVLAVFVNRQFFGFEAVFISLWVLLGVFLWSSGVLRPGGRSR